jgi:periplasmic protein TonB
VNCRIAAVILAVCIMPMRAGAAEVLGTRGGWDIYRNDDSCGMHMEFGGPGATQVTLIEYAAGNIAILVTNQQWTAKQGQEYDVEYSLNGTTYGGAKAIGTADYARSGFVSKFGVEFAEDFAKGSSLHIYLGQQQIDRLSLAGTGVAVAAVHQCLAGVRASQRADAREKARWADLPKNPFAPPPGTPQPLGNPGNWSTTNDYPSRALREEREGTTGFRVSVGADGRVTDCQVITSSGHADLDAATCDNVRRRARFKPAVDARGNPTTGFYEQSVRWVLPRDTAP